MRGKARQTAPPVSATGITPAYAGKSTPEDAVFPALEDHPRLCGEKGSLLLCFRGVAGSPPPMRGKAIDDYITLEKIGITPAYAGKSCNASH